MYSACFSCARRSVRMMKSRIPKPTSGHQANVNIKATRTDHESNTTSTLMVHRETMQILWFFVRFLHSIDFEVLSTYKSLSGTAA